MVIEHFWSIEIVEKKFLDEVIEDKWNFKPLGSLNEDIDIPKIQQYEEHMFQIYNACLESFVKFKSKQIWSQKAMEEIKMQDVCSGILKNYWNKLKDNSQVDMSKKLLEQFRSSVQKCNEIMIQFESSNQKNKETPLHDALQRDDMVYLSDIYIKEEEMLKFRDSRRSDLRSVWKQIDAFEKDLHEFDGNQTLSSLDLGEEELSQVSSLQLKFNQIQDLFLNAWSIVSSMSGDIQRFHKNLDAMQSIHSTDDDKYEAQAFLSDDEAHQNTLEKYKGMKFDMDEQNRTIDQFVNSCKMMQTENALKIIRMVERMTSKTSNSNSYKAQKLLQNCNDLESKWKYLLKVTDLPKVHDRIVNEFGRRYWFEHYLRPKEKQLERIIAAENSRRSRFITEVGENLPDNSLSQLLKLDRINLKVERSKDIPLVSDVDTEEIRTLRDEMDKESKEQRRIETLKDEIKLLNAQMKLKDQEIIQLRTEKAESIEK